MLRITSDLTSSDCASLSVHASDHVHEVHVRVLLGELVPDCAHDAVVRLQRQEIKSYECEEMWTDSTTFKRA